MLKIDIRKTIIITLIMLLLTLIINFIPPLVFLIAPFMLIPTVYIYSKSIRSYYVMSGIMIAVSIFMSIFTMQIVMASIFGGYIVGQLLIERVSKERMLYILTIFYSIYTLVSIIFLQITDYLPKVSSWFQPSIQMYNDILDKSVEDGSISNAQLEMFHTSMDTIIKQVPGIIILALFLLALIQLLITLPLLRKYKIATPNFIPLYRWQMPKSILIIYLITLLTHFSISEMDYIPLGIVTNLRYVLEWLLFIQGISLFSYFMRARQTHILLNLFIYFMAFIYAPITQLFGIIDLMVNLKKRVPRKIK